MHRPQPTTSKPAQPLTSDRIRQQRDLGVRHYQSGRLPEAEACFEQVLQSQPENPDLWRLLGIVATQQQHYSTAIERLNRAIELNPKAPNSYSTLGAVYLKQQKWPEAIECFQATTRLQPSDASAHVKLGSAYQLQGKSEEAIDAYQQALQLQPNSPQIHIAIGQIYQQTGNLNEAIASYQRVLQLQPSLSSVHAKLGQLYQVQENLDEAIASYRQALELQPDFYEVHNNLGNALKERGKFEEAIVSYHQALQLQPNDPETLNNLGTVYQALGILDEAIVNYQRVLQLQPDFYQAHSNLGNAFKERGQLDQAIASYQRALQLQPDFQPAHNNLGNAYQEQGKLDEAIASYQRALQLKPDDPVAYNTLGTALMEQGELEEAISSYQHALQLKPDYYLALNNLGFALKKQGHLTEAIACFQKVIQLQSDFAVAHDNLGTALMEQGELEEAISSYQRALQLNPDRPVTLNNLGLALKEQGHLTEAIAYFQKAIQLEPDFARAKFGLCVSQIPIIHETVDEIEFRRHNYQHCLQDLAKYYQDAPHQERQEAANAVGSLQPFFLAYQGLNDCDLQKTYGEMICQLMSSRYPQWSTFNEFPNLATNEKIRVGFVSGFFRCHSNWKLRMGWIENLDKSKFDLFGYYTCSKKDLFTVRAAQAFTSFTQGPLPVEKWGETIAKDKLHVLIFPEIGMDPMTVKLACLRLAPIQITSWGHPDTSGLPTIDYYLSSDLMEPENAQDNYIEKLVRLPNLSIYYTPLDTQLKSISKTNIGLNDDEIAFWCGQSLYKYLPQYDDIFPRIAKGLTNSKFIFIKYGKQDKITEIFQQRLTDAFERHELNYQDYCIFLPHLDPVSFASTLAIADVFLDSMSWSGCNSTLEAINYDIPIVTLPGDLMRGRHTLAILKMMNVEETIASSQDEYVKIAIRLGKDSQYRQSISRLVAENKHKLYGDLKPVLALEEFLFNAIWQRGEQPRALAAPSSTVTV